MLVRPEPLFLTQQTFITNVVHYKGNVIKKSKDSMCSMNFNGLLLISEPLKMTYRMESSSLPPARVNYLYGPPVMFLFKNNVAAWMKFRVHVALIKYLLCCT